MEDERWLMMAVLDHLQKASRRGDMKEEPLQEAIFALSNAYSLNMHNSATKERYPLDSLSLPEVYRVGRAQLLSRSANGTAPAEPSDADAMNTSASADMAADRNFQKFLMRLRETTTFFQGAEEGTPEYSRRLTRAWNKYSAKVAAKKSHDVGSSSSAGASAARDAGASEESKAEAGSLKEQGNAALKGKDYQRAHDLYTKAIDLDSENAVFYSNRAAARLHLGLFSEAVEDCKRAIALDGEFVRPRERLAASYRYLGMAKQEVDALKDALVVAPGNAALQAQLRDAEGQLSGSGAGGGAATGPGPGPGASPGMMGGLDGMLRGADPAALNNMARAMGINLPEGAIASMLNSGAADSIGNMMRDNPGLMQQAMQSMMSGGMGGLASAMGGAGRGGGDGAGGGTNGSGQG